MKAHTAKVLRQRDQRRRLKQHKQVRSIISKLFEEAKRQDSTPTLKN